MGFKGAVLKNFRCFTELTIQGIPDNARLIMLIGPNGCGKSSFLDALMWDSSADWEDDYHNKIGTFSTSGWDPSAVPEHATEWIQIDAPNLKFHFRTAFRNDAIPSVTDIEQVSTDLGSHDVKRMIENDAAVARNYQRLTQQVVNRIFDSRYGAITLNQFGDQLIRNIRHAFSNLFPDLQFTGLGSHTTKGITNTY